MSAKRRELLVTGEIYHILNRTIAREEVFSSRPCLNRAVDLFNFYRFPQKLRFSKFKQLSADAKNLYLDRNKGVSPLVEIYAFAFMPDHYHLLAKQLQETGIITFISNFQNGFAKYFNLKTKRDGGLFKRPFKSRWIPNDSQFLHISRYIHLNPVTSYLIQSKDLISYPWTSYPLYNDKNQAGLVSTKLTLNLSQGILNYNKFLADRVDYQRKLALIKKLALE